MKQSTIPITFGPLSLTYPVQVLESIAEAKAQAGNEQDVVDSINNDNLPRAAAASLVVKVVQELTKVPFLQTTIKSAAGKVTKTRDLKKDSNSGYVQRALKAVPAVTLEAVQAELNKRSTLAVSLAPKVHQGPRVAGSFREKALAFLEGKKDLVAFNKSLLAVGLSAFQANGDKETDTNNLGRLIEQYMIKTL